MNQRRPPHPSHCPRRCRWVLLLLAVLATARPAPAQDALPYPIPYLRQAGPLDVHLRTDLGNEVNLRMETAYSTQDLGNRLTTEQLDKLDTIRNESPSKFQILTCLFPRQIAEYLLRANSTPAAPDSPAPSPADDVVQRLVLEIASGYLSGPARDGQTEAQRHARADFIQASLKTLPEQPAPLRHLLEQAGRYEDPDFATPEKTGAFAALKEWYSPYRQPAMSIVGDTLRIDNQIVTESLAFDAARARMEPEEFAHACYARYAGALARWRTAQLTGNAYAGTIRRFLNDPRLAAFSPEEVSRAYQRVFGRDLKTDLEADRLTARLGHPVTYNELRTPAKE